MSGENYLDNGNKKTSLAEAVTPSSSQIVVTDGDVLEETSNFYIRLGDGPDNQVGGREIIHVTTRDGNVLSGLTRGIDCDEDPVSYIPPAFSFSVGADACLCIPASQVSTGSDGGGGSITASDIDSQDAGAGYLITADGEGHANFEAPAAKNLQSLRRVSTTNAPGATPAMDTDEYDTFVFTGLATAITSMTSGLTGTPAPSNTLWVAVTDDGTPRAITWGASFESSGNVILPATTVASTRLDVGFVWNDVSSKWRCVGVA